MKQFTMKDYWRLRQFHNGADNSYLISKISKNKLTNNIWMDQHPLSLKQAFQFIVSATKMLYPN